MLFLASVAGQIGSQTDPPYSASQGGADQLRPVRREGPGPVRRAGQHALPGHGEDGAEPLGLGGVGTASSRRSSGSRYEEWAGEKIRRVVPLGRWQTPEDIAAMAVFLASARAANVTGQTINVDGGFVMHW